MLSSPEFVPAQSVAANVVRLARERLTDALTTLAGHPDADAPAATAVHDARRGLKRLRALLRLARAGLGEETFARENAAARNAGRELSAVRDAQVLGSAFEALRGKLAGRVSPETPAAVDARLRAGVDAAVKALRSQDQVPRAVAVLTAARDRLDTWPWHGGDNWSILDTGLKKTHRAMRRAMRRAAKDGEEEDFHEWRKRTKHLGEHIALLCPLRPTAAGKTTETLGKLADALGDEHDLAVLAATLAGLGGGEIPTVDLHVIEEVIGKRRAKLRRKALRRGECFFDEGAGRFTRRWRRGWEKFREGQAVAASQVKA